MNGTGSNINSFDGIPAQFWANVFLKNRIGKDVLLDGKNVGKMTDANFHGWPNRYAVTIDGKVSGIWSMKEARVDGMVVGNSFGGHAINPKNTLIFLLSSSTIMAMAEQAYMEWCCGEGERPCQ